MSIGELRALAKCGEWAVFCAWPFIFFGFGFGMQGLSAAGSSFFREPVLAIVGAIVCVPVGLVGFFSAWAALYTNIDSCGNDARRDGVQQPPCPGPVSPGWPTMNALRMNKPGTRARSLSTNSRWRAAL